MEETGVTAATLSGAVETPYATEDDTPVDYTPPVPNIQTTVAATADNIFNSIESVWNSVRPILVDTGVINQPNTTAVNQANAAALAAQTAEKQRNLLLLGGAAVIIVLAVVLRKR